MAAESEVLVAQSCPAVFDHMNLTPWTQPHEPTRLLCPWISPGKNTGVGYQFLPQGVFPTQRWNLGLLHRRQAESSPSEPLSSWDAPQSAVCKLENQGSQWHTSVWVQSPESQRAARLSLKVWRSASRSGRVLARPWLSHSRRGKNLPFAHLSVPREGSLDWWGWCFVPSTRSNASHFQAHMHRLAQKECFSNPGHPSLRAVKLTHKMNPCDSNKSPSLFQLVSYSNVLLICA